MSAAAERRIPSLDGLRAISITLVLVSHLAGTRNFPLSASTGNFLGLGEFGVIVFLVISGFLITGLLLDELASTERIRLGRFYLRRTLWTLERGRPRSRAQVQEAPDAAAGLGADTVRIPQTIARERPLGPRIA
jgi:acyltransferase-like protein